MPVPLVTIPNVELCREGTWACSNGVFTFTREEFDAAVVAEADPDVHDGPIKIGHTDPRFQDLDGDPAYGWVRNLRVEGPVGDARLVGDLTNMPKALAELVPTVWPERSIEFGFDVTTKAGRRYAGAVFGLALLGVSPPAVQGLADVVSLYDGTGGFELAAAGAARRAVAVASLPAGVAVQVDPSALYFTAKQALMALAGRPGAPVGMAAHVGQVLDGLAGMPAASAPAVGAVGQSVAVPPSPYPGGPLMAQITDARVRELLGVAADADVEAALVAMRAQVAPPAPVAAAPVAPAPIPGTQPFIPAGYVPPALVAPVAPAPLAVPGVPAPVVAGPAPVPGIPAPVAAAPAPVPGVPAAVPAPVAAPVAAPLAPAPVAVAPAGDMSAQIAAAVAAAVQPMLAAAAAPGMQVAETLRIRDREAFLSGQARRGALRPVDIGYFRSAYDQNPTNTIAHLSAQPASFPTFEMGADTGPMTDPVASQAADDAFLASCGITG